VSVQTLPDFREAQAELAPSLGLRSHSRMNKDGSSGAEVIGCTALGTQNAKTEILDYSSSVQLIGYVGGLDEEPPRCAKRPVCRTQDVLQFCASCIGSQGEAKMIAVRPMVRFPHGLKKCWICWRQYRSPSRVARFDICGSLRK
jgi:hypothetical protein